MITLQLGGSQLTVPQLPREQRELAFQAKDAALRCLEIFLRSENFRKHLKCESYGTIDCSRNVLIIVDATHDQLVMVSFAAVFLLKM